MPRKTKTDNGDLPGQTTFKGDDFAAIAEAADKLREHDAANPVDDFNPGEELKRVLKLKTKIENAKNRAEAAKADLKETIQYIEAKNAAETYKGLVAELDDQLVELGREYPLFEGRRA